MISGDFTHCETLQQFYDEIVALQTKAHGADYCSHHRAISAMIASASSAAKSKILRHAEFYDIPTPKVVYRELGVNQGATAALAALSGADVLQLVDISLKPFEPHRRFFNDPNITLETHEKSSIDPALVEQLKWCDVLFVDTVHHPDHVRKELQLHAPKTTGVIIIHDTGTFPEIHRAAVETLRGKWDAVVHDTSGCGYSVFFKTPNSSS
jgi:hypothetical protein